jgi:predicted alpha/beta-hydrolase family hydrolase
MRGVSFQAEGMRGFLHRPDSAPDGARDPIIGAGLVLTHGAGGNCNAPLLVAAAAAFSAAGLHVLRCDLPFRQRRPSGPPSPASAVHGTADPFGSIAELRLAIALIPAPTRVLPVESAGHDLRRGLPDLDAVVAAARDQLGVI